MIPVCKWTCTKHGDHSLDHDECDQRFDGWFCKTCHNKNMHGHGIDNLDWLPEYIPFTDEERKNAAELPSAYSILADLRKMA